MIKISGRHKSVPRELKRTLTAALPPDAKVVMSDICSCRHAFKPGTLKVTDSGETTLKLRGYFGSGVVNFFVKLGSINDKQSIIDKLMS